MGNGKSPGSDGLPPEFYKIFEHLLVDDLHVVYGCLLKWEDAGKQKIKIIAQSFSLRNKQEIQKDLRNKESYKTRKQKQTELETRVTHDWFLTYEITLKFFKKNSQRAQKFN